MARKEIKFRNNRGTHEGRQDGVIYRIVADRTLLGTAAPAYTVDAYDTKGKGRTISTRGHFRLHLDGAKEFCQQIAAGEIDLEELRQRFAAEDAAKEQAAVQAATAEAKEFRTKLEAAAIALGYELQKAIRWAEVYNWKLAHIYHHTKKRRIRKKYAKRILAWYREEVAQHG